MNIFFGGHNSTHTRLDEKQVYREEGAKEESEAE